MITLEQMPTDAVLTVSVGVRRRRTTVLVMQSTSTDLDDDGPLTEEPAVSSDEVDWEQLRAIAVAHARRFARGDTDAAHEIAQSALLSVVAAVQAGRVVQPFGYLSFAVHTHGIKFLRGESARGDRSTSDELDRAAADARAAAHATSSEDTVVGIIEVARLLTALFDHGGLTDEQRHVVVAIHLRETALEEVAASLGRPVDETVELLRSAERQMLQGAGLTARQAQAVTMVVLQGWTNDGAAQILGIRANTFAVRLRDGKQKLGAWLARNGGQR